MGSLFFQQLFEATSSSYTYILADEVSKDAIIIDPVLDTIQRDLTLLKELGFHLNYTLETHLHADHVSGSGPISDATGAQIAISAKAEIVAPHIALNDEDLLTFGKFSLKAIATPGHTKGCMSFLVSNLLFTGDALLIRGNGRTDLQEGSSETLYRSIHEKIFSLPDETFVYPGHDYKGLTSSTIGLEKKLNSRLGGGRNLNEFVQIMESLKLDPPKKIKIAIPANLKCGRI